MIWVVSVVRAICIIRISWYQGCGLGVENVVGVGGSRLFCLESESKIESVKFYLLRPKSQDTTRQQTIILPERLCIVTETLKARTKTE